MFGIFKIKSLLIAALLAAPSVGWWMQRPSPVPSPAPASISEPAVRVPVEIIAKGSAPELVYVNVGNQAVPEPGAITLVMLASTLLVLRRQRG